MYVHKVNRILFQELVYLDLLKFVYRFITRIYYEPIHTKSDLQ